MCVFFYYPHVPVYVRLTKVLEKWKLHNHVLVKICYRHRCFAFYTSKIITCITVKIIWDMSLPPVSIKLYIYTELQLRIQNTKILRNNSIRIQEEILLLTEKYYKLIFLL